MVALREKVEARANARLRKGECESTTVNNTFAWIFLFGRAQRDSRHTEVGDLWIGDDISNGVLRSCASNCARNCPLTSALLPNITARKQTKISNPRAADALLPEASKLVAIRPRVKAPASEERQNIPSTKRGAREPLANSAYPVR